MIVTYDNLNALNNAQQAVNKLARTPLNPKMAYRIHKLLDSAHTETEKLLKEFKTEIADKFTFKDADGTEKKYAPEKEEEYKTAITAFGKRTVEIKHNKVPLSYLENAVKLTVAEIMVLEPFLDIDVETTESATEVKTPTGLTVVG